MEKYIVTISRQFASLGRSIAQKMSEDLEINFYDRDIVEATAKRLGLPVSTISSEEEQVHSKFWRRKYPLGMGVGNIQDEIFNVQKNIICDFANENSCIIVGRCSNQILEDYARCLNIYIYAPYEARLKNCVEVLKMDVKVAKKMIHDIDLARERYRQQYSNPKKSIFDSYDLMVDSSRLGVEKTADMLSTIVKDVFG